MSAQRFALPLSLVLLGVGALSGHAQREALRPHSAYEPPLAAAAATLMASQSSAPADLLTTGERSNWQQTGDYAEILRLMHAMEKRSPYVRVVRFGTTSEDRPRHALIVSKDRAFTPEAAKRSGKAIIFMQSGIHSGEIEGKDTSLMRVRDMSSRRGRTKPHGWIAPSSSSYLYSMSMGMRLAARSIGPTRTAPKSRAHAKQPSYST